MDQLRTRSYDEDRDGRRDDSERAFDDSGERVVYAVSLGVNPVADRIRQYELD